MRFKVMTGFALLAAMIAGKASTSDGPTVGDYIAEGVSRNPEVAAARERVTAARARVPQLRALPEPDLRFTWMPAGVQARTGPQEARFAVTQMVPWMGVRKLRGETGERELARLEAELDVAMVELARSIKHAYYEYAYLAEEVRVTRDNLDLLQQLEPVVQRKFQVGGSQEDLLRLQMEIGRIEDALISLEASRRPRSTQLAATIGIESGDPLPWPRLIPPESSPLDRDRLRAIVRDHNPALAVIEQEIERENTEVALAAKASRPDFGFGFEYIATGEESNPESAMSGENPLAVMFMIQLPLRRDRYRAVVTESVARRAAAQMMRDQLRNQIAAELEQALFGLEDADRKIALYRDTLIPRARQVLILTLRAYQTESANMLDWIGTERELLEFDRAMSRAIADYYIRQADLEALCGGSMHKDVSP